MKVRIPKRNIAEHNAKMAKKEQIANLTKPVKNINSAEKKGLKIACYCRIGHPNQLD